MQWNGRSMSSKLFSLKKYVLFFVRCSFPWFVLLQPPLIVLIHCFFFKTRDLLRDACAHQRNIFHSFCSYCDPSIHKLQLDHLVSCLWAARLYISVSGVKVEDGSEFGDGGARREGFFRGNRVMMRIPCACSLRGLSVGSVVEYEESEQALNLTVTLKVLKQQSFKKCWVSSGLVLITRKQRDTRVKLEQGSKQISQFTVNM